LFFLHIVCTEKTNYRKPKSTVSQLSDVAKTKGTALTLSGSHPYRSGCVFMGWNTKADGSGTAYAPGASYKTDASVTLYAQWRSSSPTVDWWLSDTEYGTSVSDPLVGNRYYFCYRVYDHISGKDWNSVADSSYQVTMELFNPDGTLNYSTTKDSTDRGWISTFYTLPGRYRRALTIDGEIDFYGSQNFTVANNPMKIYCSESSVSLKLGGTASRSVMVWVGGYYPNDAEISWSRSNENVSCQWGEWNSENKIPLTITASSEGSSVVTLSVKDKATGAVLDSTAVSVSVSAEKYTVAYNANGGSGAPASQTKSYNTALTLSSTKPTKAFTVTYNANGGTVSPSSKNISAVFNGWNTKADGSGTSYFPGGRYTANAALTLYARWTNPAAGTLAVPSRTGYTFDGWYTSASGGTKVTSSSVISSSITLYAQWKQNFRLDMNGSLDEVSRGNISGIGTADIYINGTKVSSSVSDYCRDWPVGTTYEIKNIKAAAGYQYLGNAGYSGTISSGNVTVVLPFKLVSIVVSYNANGGSGAPAAQIKARGTALALSTVKPTRTGHNFLSWNTKSDGTGTSYTSGSSYTQDMPVTLYARWEKCTYAVKYDANGGSGAPAAQTKIYGTALTLSSAKPARTGYNFLGWNTKADGSGTNYASGSPYTQDAPVTLYARWEKCTYAVKYDANGGSGAPAAQTKIFGTSLTLSSAKPSRTGYNFLGWNTKADGSGTNYAAGSSYTADSAVTLYAHWEKKTYTVKYDANGGTGAPAAQTKTHGLSLTLSGTVPSRTGWNFLGWNTKADGSGTNYAAGSAYISDSVVTLYAHWEKKTYTVKYDANGGTDAPAAQAKTHGTALTLTSKVPTRDGYVFAGWNTLANGQGVSYASGASYTIDGATVLYAQWVDGDYTIRYNASGGTGAPAAQTKLYGQPLTLSDKVLYRFGYSFLGWNTYYSAPVALYKPGDSFTANADTTLYAAWKPESYIPDNTVNSKFTAVIPLEGGCDFFSFTPTAGGLYRFESSGGMDTIITVYDANGFVLDSDNGSGQGGNFLLSINLEPYQKVYIRMMSADGREGRFDFSVTKSYTIFCYSNSTRVPYFTVTKVHGVDAVLSSSVPARSFTVNFNANGGSVSASSKVISADFLNWNTSRSGSGTAYYPGSTIKADLSFPLYAQWKPAVYGALPVPSRTGYTFCGWYTSASGGERVTESSVITASVTLYARWTKDTSVTTSASETTTMAKPTTTTKITTTAKPTTTTTKTTTTAKPTTTAKITTTAKPTTTTTKTTTTAKPTTTTKITTTAKPTTTTKITTTAKPTTTTTKTTTTVKPTTTTKITTTAKPTTTAATRPTSAASGGIIRISGSDRRRTAVEISKKSRSKAVNVILASGDNYADALAGVPLAYALDAPILLVRNHRLDDATMSEIKRLGAKNIYILGGTAAVGKDVFGTLSEKGYNVERIYGRSRFDTAVEIAARLQAVSGKPSEVFFAYSHNYPDALAISGVAALKKAPVLYISGDGSLSDSTWEHLKSCGADKGTILGGTGVISGDAEDTIRAAGMNDVGRIYGRNRYDTCMRINQTYSSLLCGDTICVATGINFPDALSGGVFTALRKAPLMLVNKELTDDQKAFIDSRNPRTVYVFGGAGAVSDFILQQIDKLMPDN